ncbi:hypothetical protein AcW1_001692 [Taiwanofungus camphoratus]|nr:hypothetical protein AcV5_000266 [Antrodia cinnamomea]KAI0944864.1 hypothetical protein AcV7_001550 [Antrodia cinnamomea]KAI0945477.1 hypothetical protein AcW1_001692 [Antrodia cinnamomea]
MASKLVFALTNYSAAALQGLRLQMDWRDVCTEGVVRRQVSHAFTACSGISPLTQIVVLIANRSAGMVNSHVFVDGLNGNSVYRDVARPASPTAHCRRHVARNEVRVWNVRKLVGVARE